MSTLRFYLGTHCASWLWKIHDVPLFVSHRRLDGMGTGPRISRYPKATTSWALDSGGFTELKRGGWQTTPEEYVAAVRRYDDELGSMEWAAPQDWMCEPGMLARTGLTVAEHQQRTLENYLQLTEMAPDLGFIPVLQGWAPVDYRRHADAYEAAGVDLASLALVGVGSVCRRQGRSVIADLFDSLAARGYSLHGFGVKAEGLAIGGDHLTSADSLAWSFGERSKALAGARGCEKNSCANCLHAALEWRARVLASLGNRQHSISMYAEVAG